MPAPLYYPAANVRTLVLNIYINFNQFLIWSDMAVLSGINNFNFKINLLSVSILQSASNISDEWIPFKIWNLHGSKQFCYDWTVHMRLWYCIKLSMGIEWKSLGYKLSHYAYIIGIILYHSFMICQFEFQKHSLMFYRFLLGWTLSALCYF